MDSEGNLDEGAVADPLRKISLGPGQLLQTDTGEKSAQDLAQGRFRPGSEF